MYVAPTMRIGAWLMAHVQRQRIEYYYSIYDYCLQEKQLQLSEKENQMVKQQMIRAEGTIKSKQQQIQEMKQKVSLVCEVTCV